MRRRLLGGLAALVVLGCATAVLLDWAISDWGLDRDYPGVAAALVAVILAAIFSVWAALLPANDS
jgi:hypothetical protein